MAIEKGLTITPTPCDGAPIQPGGEAPLQQPITVHVVRGNAGNVIQVDGCRYFVNGKCIATGATPPSLGPDCVWMPPSEKSAAIPTKVLVSTPKPDVAIFPQQSLTPQKLDLDEDSIEKDLEEMQTGYLVPNDHAVLLRADIRELGEMVSNAEKFIMILQRIREDYALMLKSIAPKPTYKERWGDEFDDQYVEHSKVTSAVISTITAMFDKSGNTEVVKNKTLKNDLQEPFRFEFAFDDGGQIKSANVLFSHGQMNFSFENGQINKIYLKLETFLPTLALYEMENSRLSRYMFLRRQQEDQKPTQITMVFDFSDQEKGYTFDLAASYTPSYYLRESLTYSKKYNKLVKQDDLDGKGGMKAVVFTALLAEALSILPFDRMKGEESLTY